MAIYTVKISKIYKYDIKKESSRRKEMISTHFQRNVFKLISRSTRTLTEFKGSGIKETIYAESGTLKNTTKMAPSTRDYDDISKLSYYQPYYVSPFPVGINPNYSKWLERYCCEWSVNNGGALARSESYRLAIERSDVGLFSAVCFTNASAHRLEKLVKWGQMLFISDDYLSLMKRMNSEERTPSLSSDNNNNPCSNDDSATFWKDLLDALDSLAEGNKYPNPKWSDFVRGIHEVMREIYFDFQPHQIRRSATMIGRYIRSSIEESKWKSDNIPSWQEYHRVRIGTVGIDMCMQLIEYSQNVTLTDEEFYHPRMADLFGTVSEELYLINDLLTFRKEVAESDYKFSRMKHSFTVLVGEGKSLQEAVDWIYRQIIKCDRLIEQQIGEILQNESIVKDPETRDKLEQFFTGVRYFIGGYWRHAITARRYHGLEFCGALPPEGNFKYCEDHTILKPTRNHPRYEWLVDVL